MKFKEGDRVKVRDSCKIEGGIYAGKQGYIHCIDRGVPYPYEVLLDDDKEPTLFATRELEGGN